MSERYESLSAQDILERNFSPEVCRAVERLKNECKTHDMTSEALTHTLKRIMAADNVEISEGDLKSLEDTIQKNRLELGLGHSEKSFE